MRLFSREEFAARRTSAQDRAIDTLLPTIARALTRYGQDEWWRSILVPARSLFNDTIRADTGMTRLRTASGWAPVAAALRESLAKTSKPDQFTARTIATWIATYVINAAAEASVRLSDETLALVWVSMHDSKVRHTHQDMDGQRRPVGDTFDLDGTKTPGPGYPIGPLELWIGCRCHLQPTKVASMVAAADNASGVVIVALPAEDDPTNALHGADDSGERPEPGHMTIAWLGHQGENPDLNVDEIDLEVAAHSQQLAPFTAAVKETTELGDDGALVWMLDPQVPTNVRNRILATPAIEKAVEAVEQHPSYLPHVTVGYDVPLSGDGVDALSSVESISFDRLALWDGENHYEYTLGSEDDAMTAATQEQETPPAVVGIPWHGVLAPEGQWSGDGRMFAEGALTFRDLPLPLTWQKTSDDGHKGSVVVAKIERLARVEGEMRASGHYLTTPEADEALGLVANFGRFGVSVDADDAEFELGDDDDKITFTKARISSASQVPIPAFSQAWLALGDTPDGFMPDDCDPASPDYEQCMRDKGAEPGGDTVTKPAMSAFVSEKSWDGSAGRFTPEQWKASCILHVCDGMEKSCHKLPIKEPGGQLSRAGVHAAASRIGQVDAPSDKIASAKRALRGAYSQLDEQVPDALKADAGEFGRGPGWLTNPKETKRLHDYWTVPGNAGYAKVAWGTPGDFDRCRVEIGEEIGEGSPEDLRFLNQICAQWHHDATGRWPGEDKGVESGDVESFDWTEQLTSDIAQDVQTAPALSIVASSGWCAPSEWFRDPELDHVSALTVTEEGRVFGHLAAWESCHIDPQYAGTCVAPPHSSTGYAYFLTGEILTDQGSIPVGSLTIDTGHAGAGNARRSMAHYDNTGTVAAYVTCGEDAHGIWVAGCVSPNATDGQVIALRGAKLSGDWRRIGASPDLELIAALAVNSGGLPIPRTRVGVAAGLQTSLVAAGLVVDNPSTSVDIPTLARAVEDELEARTQRRTRLAALAHRVNGSN